MDNRKCGGGNNMGIGEMAMNWDYISRHCDEEFLLYLKLKYGEEIDYNAWVEINKEIKNMYSILNLRRSKNE